MSEFWLGVGLEDEEKAGTAGRLRYLQAVGFIFVVFSDLEVIPAPSLGLESQGPKAVDQDLSNSSTSSSTSSRTSSSTVTSTSSSKTTQSISVTPTSSPVSFTAEYGQADQFQGIGTWNFLNTIDRSFAFDYEHSGKLDYIVTYRPGSGSIHITKNTNGNFTSVYESPDPGNGIGGFDLHEPEAIAFAFDYDHSGKLDHLVFYVPGTGTMWILKNVNGSFSAVFSEGSPGNGIAGYSLSSPNDRAFAFDYDHSGRQDYIVLYRPGTGTVWIIGNNDGTFSPVYKGLNPFGGYDLESPADLAFAFDYAQSGMMDYIILYRPGTGAIFIVEHGAGSNNFAAVYQQGYPGNGIGGFPISSSRDLAFAFDYSGVGRQDHLFFYRSGTGIVCILQNNMGNFTPVYGQTSSGDGIGGADFKDSADLAYAFDYQHSGKLDHILVYGPGSGAVFIIGRV